MSSRAVNAQPAQHSSATHRPKLLKLETLSRRQAHFIVLVNWIAVVFACVFGAFEYRLRIESHTVAAEQTGEYAYRAVVEDFSPASRFVLCNVLVELDGSAQMNASDWIAPMFVPHVAGLDDDAQWHALFNTNNFSSQFERDSTLCLTNDTVCRVGSVYWSDAVRYSTYEFEIRVQSLQGDAALDLGVASVRDVRFVVTRHNATFTLVELTLVMTLCFITVVSFLYWIVLWQRSRRLLPEQRWMPFLLLSLLGGQRPLFALAALLPYDFAAATAAGVLQVCSYAAASVYVLLLLDGLSYRTREYPWSFYLPKAMFGVVLTGIGCTWSVLDRDDLATVSLTDPIVLLLVIGFAIGTLLMMAVWLVWVIHVFLRTRHRLARVPFVSNRWRQLSFRFVSVISTTFFLFAIISLILTVVSQTNFAGATLLSHINAAQIEATYMWLSTLVLISTYVYSVAYVYLPPSANWLCHHDDDLLEAASLLPQTAFSIRRRGANGRFCLEDAALCLEVAYQAYYDESAERRTVSGFGLMDHARIERWGHIVTEFISEDENDTHVIVTRNAGTIVVAMRGTASFENAMTDLKMSMVLLPKPQHEHTFPEPRVHKGFFIAFTCIWPRVLGAVRIAEKQARASGVRQIEVLCTGHSLGGALATLTALYMRWSLPPEIAVQMISFGSPRVGSYSFARLYNRCVPHSWRVVCDRDIVAGLPKFGFMYKHVGTEVMIDRRGNIIADQSYVERFFQPPRRSFRDHLLEHYRRSFLAALSRHGAARSALARRIAADGDSDIVSDALRSMQYDDEGYVLDVGESESDSSDSDDDRNGDERRHLVKAREPASAKAQRSTAILAPAQVPISPIQSPASTRLADYVDGDDDGDDEDDEDDDEVIVSWANGPVPRSADLGSVARPASTSSSTRALNTNATVSSGIARPISSTNSNNTANSSSNSSNGNSGNAVVDDDDDDDGAVQKQQQSGSKRGNVLLI